MAAKYPVNYGVNNSHITEWEFFERYSDAKIFLDNLPDGFNCGVIFKWEPKLNSYWQTVKKYKFEPGVDNSAVLRRYNFCENGKLI